ncbi:alpha/beta hydrolase [Butyrivibrio sp. CB08]|uniref:alpha/beta hydrolase n=1 Tax=Butyrivibrio sp. CB08 TaxID=2364879 RepID=UPI000EAA7CF0|nr:alpha/beta hydrolase [Butyrivibrio sp. CB08]RKM58862.1 alpha/beta hydrolase [Butyrivibrio sp. CB08]
MSKKNTFLKLGIFTALFGGVYAFSDYIYKISTKPHEHHGANDFDPAITEGRRFVRNHVSRQDVFIEAIDQIRLHASYIPAADESHNYVILIHGIWDNHESNGIYAKHYLEKGFNCLLPDLRGFGESEGDYIGYGLDDRLDIMEWIYWLIKKDKEAKIILHGMSMGAATTLLTTGEHLPENVKGAIADSSYSTLREQFAATYKSFPGSFLPTPIALAVSRAIIYLRAGYDINDVTPIKAVEKSETPTLFIHGDDDRFIDPHMCSRLYEAASCKKQYCMILGAAHIEGVVKDPTNYWLKVDSFINKIL